MRSIVFHLLRCRPYSSRLASSLIGWAVFWALCHPLPAALQSRGEQGQVVHQGIAVRWEVQPAVAQSDVLQEGDEAVFRFTITDTATGMPVRGANPAVWVDVQRQGGITDCTRKVAALSGGSMLSRPAVDLNNYFVLALNQDATISVVDPRFQFGGSKLLALVALKSPGVDWALTADQSMLFVSVPDAGEVAVIETVSWKVLSYLPVGPNPARLGIQPDGRNLWVTYGSAASARESGVAVFNLRDLKLAARIQTGGGPHLLAFSDDSRFAFVSNAAAGKEAGTVTLVETARLASVIELAVGRRPVSLTYSKSAQAAYLADEADGSVIAIDPLRQKITARLQLDPGLRQIKFAPGDRYAVVINSARNVAQVIDASANRLVQAVAVRQEPDQISFSDKLVYIRHRRSEQVLLLPLDQLGRADQPLSPADFPGGQNPLGKLSLDSLADTIIPAPGSGAMLVANPADKAIYYYQEGMAAPMGTFSNYKREPRAVLVVDRTLRELSPGTYQTSAKLPGAGRYELVFFLNAPRITHCSVVEVHANPRLAGEAKKQPPLVQPLVSEQTLRVGEKAALRFKLSDAVTRKPLNGLTDVRVLTFLAPGIWQQRQMATLAEDGTYGIDFVPPQSGMYYVFVEAPSLGLMFSNSQALILEAKEAGQKQ